MAFNWICHSQDKFKSYSKRGLIIAAIFYVFPNQESNNIRVPIWYNFLLDYALLPDENVGFCAAISFAVMSG